MTITGAAEPLPVRYTTPVPSAQVKSAVLLAGLNAPGQTVVIEAEATRDHTERMLAGFGAEITTEVTEEGRVITLTGQPELKPQTIAVPRDPSSADEHRFVGKLRIVALFDGRVECVTIHMCDVEVEQLWMRNDARRSAGRTPRAGVEFGKAISAEGGHGMYFRTSLLKIHLQLSRKKVG